MLLPVYGGDAEHELHAEQSREEQRYDGTVCAVEIDHVGLRYGIAMTYVT